MGWWRWRRWSSKSALSNILSVLTNITQQSTWNPNAAGGRTPAYVANSGGKTPAYSGTGLEAPTPGAYSAPTPGAYSAPTPGSGYGDRGAAYNTPANYATPGGFPETPAPYSAETPAASNDDGPR